MRERFEEHPYLIAIGLTVALVATHFFAPSYLTPAASYLLFVAVIALSAWIGGFGPGLAATALAAGSTDLLLLEPRGVFSGKAFNDLSALMTFIAVGVAISSLFHLRLKERIRMCRKIEETEAALERAEEANNMKRNFIANMSHEIRTPLSAILGFSELLASDKVAAEEKQGYLERLKVNANSLTHLVADLLDVTEVNSAFFVANRKRMSLPGFIQEVYAAFETLAHEKGLKFQVQLRGSIPTYVESDREQLMQILRQVIGNSLRYSEQGLVKLTVSASKTEDGRREVAFIVSDQGPGVPSDLRQKLFRPFPGETPLPTKTHGGTGFGLTVARKLARGLGGDVKVAKSDRKGTTVLITFDGGPVNEMSELVERLAENPTRLSPDDPHALEGTRILVVDDSPDSALLVSRMLQTVGADVQTATRGEEGVEKALEAQPDVVLMDIQMPEVDGYEATRRLRARGFSKPIIALSAHVMKEDREAASRSGSDEYLMKPVSRRALLEMVGRYVRSKGRRPMAPA